MFILLLFIVTKGFFLNRLGALGSTENSLVRELPGISVYIWHIIIKDEQFHFICKWFKKSI